MISPSRSYIRIVGIEMPRISAASPMEYNVVGEFVTICRAAGRDIVIPLYGNLLFHVAEMMPQQISTI
jgi:hypothetical protein